MNTETRNELIINVNYIKSVKFSGGLMLDFVPLNNMDNFLYDELVLGEKYYQRPLLKIVTDNDAFTLSFNGDAPAEEIYSELRKRLASPAGRPFFCINLNSTLYRVGVGV